MAENWFESQGLEAWSSTRVLFSVGRDAISSDPFTVFHRTMGVIRREPMSPMSLGLIFHCQRVAVNHKVSKTYLACGEIGRAIEATAKRQTVVTMLRMRFMSFSVVYVLLWTMGYVLEWSDIQDTILLIYISNTCRRSPHVRRLLCIISRESLRFVYSVRDTNLREESKSRLVKVTMFLSQHSFSCSAAEELQRGVKEKLRMRPIPGGRSGRPLCLVLRFIVSP